MEISNKKTSGLGRFMVVFGTIAGLFGIALARDPEALETNFAKYVSYIVVTLGAYILGEALLYFKIIDVSKREETIPEVVTNFENDMNVVGKPLMDSIKRYTLVGFIIAVVVVIFIVIMRT